MNWEAIGAIGQVLGALITFIVGCIAMFPYMKKCKVYFSFMYNVDKKPTFVITNNSQKGQFLNRIIIYSGKWSKKSFCVIEMLDIQDDLLIDNTEFFIAPNSHCKISANATRMVKYITHCEVYLAKYKNVYIQYFQHIYFSLKIFLLLQVFLTLQLFHLFLHYLHNTSSHSLLHDQHN